MKPALIVPGHTLWVEGAPFELVDGKPRRIGWSGVGGVGAARCSCGTFSPVLPSGAARRRWHRDHKRQVQTDAFHATRDAEQFY